MNRFTCLLTFLLYHVVSEKGRYVVIYVGCYVSWFMELGFTLQNGEEHYPASKCIYTLLVYYKRGIACKQGEYHVMFNGIYPSSVCNLTSSIEIDGKKSELYWEYGGTPCRRENREESFFASSVNTLALCNDVCIWLFWYVCRLSAVRKP